MTDTGVSNKSIKKAHFSESGSHKSNEIWLVDDKANDKRVHCHSYILEIGRRLDRAFTYADLGGSFTYGTLRNNISALRKSNVLLKLPEENPARFILPEWAHRPEYSCVQRNDKNGTVGRFDFLSYLESLGWESVLGVHDLKLSFMVYHLHWIDNTWEYCKQSRSYRRCFSLSYPVSVQCFDTGTVLVSIRCSSGPFPLDLAGISSLAILLGEVKGQLHALCIPDPSTWLIVQWHLNRDTVKLEGSGLDVNLTFQDFFSDSARFYFKHGLDRFRAEVSQSPKRTVQEIFEKIMDRDSSLRRLC